MCAIISFKRDRSNSAKERIGDEEQTGGPSLLRREAYLGHERLVSWENMHRTMGREKKERTPPLFLHPRVTPELIIIFSLLWSTGNLCGGENIA